MTEHRKKAGCPHCQFVEQAGLGTLSTKVLETEQVIVIAGDHQYFPGYCVVIAKSHVREMHNLPTEEAAKVFADVLTVGRKIEGAFQSHKMNYVSLGNVVEHLHWHVIPRKESDPDHKDHPWKNMEKYSEKPTTQDAINQLRAVFKCDYRK
jgi:diadenosine tetraphosphate (Ap4A) HIT family hydrolase